MVGTNEVLRQFHRLNFRPSIWARAEIKELARIMVPGEQLTNVVFGWYENGFALLTCTDQRVLLIDKKPFFLKIEDLRYDKISEIKFLNRLLDSSVILSYAGQKLDFKSWDQRGLRKLVEQVQDTILQINQFQWRANDGQYAVQQSPGDIIQRVANTRVDEPVYELTAYPDDLMQRAQLDLNLTRNPYAPTTKFMRRRVPLLGFNQTSR